MHAQELYLNYLTINTSAIITQKMFIHNSERCCRYWKIDQSRIYYEVIYPKLEQKFSCQNVSVKFAHKVENLEYLVSTIFVFRTLRRHPQEEFFQIWKAISASVHQGKDFFRRFRWLWLTYDRLDLLRDLKIIIWWKVLILPHKISSWWTKIYSK